MFVSVSQHTQVYTLKTVINYFLLKKIPENDYRVEGKTVLASINASEQTNKHNWINYSEMERLYCVDTAKGYVARSVYIRW